MEGRQLLRPGCLPTGPRCRARVLRPAAASLTAATATALMILRPTHSRVIMAAAITGRDSTARYSAMRGPTAAWRATAQGGPHREAMAISLSLSLSLSGETFTVEAMEIAKREGCDVVAVHEFFWTDAGYAAIRQII